MKLFLISLSLFPCFCFSKIYVDTASNAFYRLDCNQELCVMTYEQITKPSSSSLFGKKICSYIKGEVFSPKDQVKMDKLGNLLYQATGGLCPKVVSYVISKDKIKITGSYLETKNTEVCSEMRDYKMEASVSKSQFINLDVSDCDEISFI